jgi:hypothetical protein
MIDVDHEVDQASEKKEGHECVKKVGASELTARRRPNRYTLSVERFV